MHEDGASKASRPRNRDERERREKQDGITRRDFLDGAAVERGRARCRGRVSRPDRR